VHLRIGNTSGATLTNVQFTLRWSRRGGESGSKTVTVTADIPASSWHGINTVLEDTEPSALEWLHVSDFENGGVRLRR
jgi:hypothetical protein